MKKLLFTIMALLALASGCKKSAELSEPVESKLLAISAPDSQDQVTVTTFSGGAEGYQDGPRLLARYSYTDKLAFGPDGSLYIVETNSKTRIRKISCDGIVSTIFEDNTDDNELFIAIAVDKKGEVFVTAANKFYGVLRISNGKAIPLAGSYSRGFAPFLDGNGLNARFASLTGITIGPDDNLYVVDSHPSNRVRKITKQGVVTTVAGTGQYGNVDGPASTAQFNSPYGITVKKDGTIYLVEYAYFPETKTLGSAIRKISNGIVSTIAKGNAGFLDGKSPNVKFGRLMDLTVTEDGSLYIVDGDNNRIRKVTEDGTVTTAAGGNNDFGFLRGIALYRGSLYTSEWHRIRKIDFK